MLRLQLPLPSLSVPLPIPHFEVKIEKKEETAEVCSIARIVTDVVSTVFSKIKNQPVLDFSIIWYDLKKTRGKQLECSLNGQAVKINELRGIYFLANTTKNRVYIGKSYTVLERINQHFRSAENNERELYKDLCNKKNKFVLTFVEIDIEQDLNDYENKVIELAKKTFDLYNKNKGGGGGYAHAEEKKVTYEISPNFFQSSKSYAFDRASDGRVKLLTSPGFRKLSQEKKPCAYTIENEELVEENYVGVTVGPYSRAHSHVYLANQLLAEVTAAPTSTSYFHDVKSAGDYSSVKKKHGKLLHQRLKSSPTKFRLKVRPLKIRKKNMPLRPDCAYPKGLQEVERHLIFQKKSLRSAKNPLGMNMKSGGGGPIGKCLTKFAKKSFSADV